MEKGRTTIKSFTVTKKTNIKIENMINILSNLLIRTVSASFSHAYTSLVYRVHASNKACTCKQASTVTKFDKIEPKLKRKIY